MPPTMRTKLALLILMLLPMYVVGKAVVNFWTPDHGGAIEVIVDLPEVDALDINMDALERDIEQATLDAAPSERRIIFDRSLDVGAGGVLTLRTDDLDVLIETTETAGARFRVEGTPLDQPDERLDVRLTRSGDAIEARFEEVSHHGSLGPARLIVTLPQRFDVEIATGDGDIRLDRLDGNVDVRTDDGRIRLETVRGNRLAIRSADGDVDLGTVESANVDIAVADGSIRVGRLVADRFALRATDGDVRVAELNGAGSIATTDGSVRLQDATGRALRVRTEDGSIRADHLATHDADLHSRKGHMRIGGAGESLRIRTAEGTVRLYLDEALDADVRNQKGDIYLSLDPALGVRLDLEADELSVDSAFAIDGSVDTERVSGMVNQGGPSIRAETTRGRLELRRH